MCPSGVIASYLHASSAPGLGKMGALVALGDREGALDAASAAKLKVSFSACQHACPTSDMCLTLAGVLSYAKDQATMHLHAAMSGQTSQGRP